MQNQSHTDTADQFCNVVFCKSSIMLLQQYTVFYGLLHWWTVSNDTGASMCFSSLMVAVTVSLNCQMPVLPQTYVPRNVHKSADTCRHFFCQRFQYIFAKCRASRSKLNLMLIYLHPAGTFCPHIKVSSSSVL